jgi:hypothetical protein
MIYLIVLTHIMTNLMNLNDTIRYTIHDTIQNVTIHDTNYDSTSMVPIVALSWTQEATPFECIKDQHRRRQFMRTWHKTYGKNGGRNKAVPFIILERIYMAGAPALPSPVKSDYRDHRIKPCLG